MCTKSIIIKDTNWKYVINVDPFFVVQPEEAYKKYTTDTNWKYD